MELVPPEIIRMDDGGVAKALVESRLWWPACDENGQEKRGAGKRGGGGQFDDHEDEQGSESECSDSSGDGQDSELFVIGEELPGRSEVRRPRAVDRAQGNQSEPRRRMLMIIRSHCTRWWGA